MSTRQPDRKQIAPSQGRALFGDDPAGYDVGRPDYPERVYRLLVERCGLGPGCRVLEVGAGTGRATRRIAAHHPARIVAIEPDARLARRLRSALPDTDRITLIEEPFEDAVLPAASFDLAVSATAFHWIEQRPGLERMASLLRAGGWWAAWWTLFGDPENPDAFLQAAQPLLDDLMTGPSHSVHDKRPFALDVERRLADLAETGGFEPAAVELIRWTAQFDTARLRALYATFSTVSVLGAEEQGRILGELVRLAESEFGGLVERNLVTAVYTARRRAQ